MSVIITTNGEVLKTITKALSRISNSARVHFKEDEIVAEAIDPANVALIILRVPSNSLDGYSIEEETTIGIDTNNLDNMLKSAKKRDHIKLSLNDNTLTLEIGHIKYSTVVLDPSSVKGIPGNIPSDLPAKIVLDAGLFKEVTNLADIITDHVKLESDENAFTIEARGDIDSLKVELTQYELIEFNQEKAVSYFSVEYLKEFNKIASKGDILTILLGTDLPAYFKYDVADGKVEATFVLAPRIEE